MLTQIQQKTSAGCTWQTFHGSVTTSCSKIKSFLFTAPQAYPRHDLLSRRAAPATWREKCYEGMVGFHSAWISHSLALAGVEESHCHHSTQTQKTETQCYGCVREESLLSSHHARDQEAHCPKIPLPQAVTFLNKITC